jgi:hypothetical protein
VRGIRLPGDELSRLVEQRCVVVRVTSSDGTTAAVLIAKSHRSQITLVVGRRAGVTTNRPHPGDHPDRLQQLLDQRFPAERIFVDR